MARRSSLHFTAVSDANNNFVLGVEHANIAFALTIGRGFSDPFGSETGPTAWMPPLYPILIAAFYAPSMSSEHAIRAVLLLKNLTLILSGWIIFVAAKRSGNGLSPRVALIIYGLFLYAHFWWFFQHTHDVWLLLLLVDLSLVGAWFWLPAKPSLGRHLGWGLLGGLTFLSSPVGGLAWLGICGIVAWTTGLGRRMALAVLVAVVCAGGWDCSQLHHVRPPRVHQVKPLLRSVPGQLWYRRRHLQSGQLHQSPGLCEGNRAA